MRWDRISKHKRRFTLSDCFGDYLAYPPYQWDEEPELPHVSDLKELRAELARQLKMTDQCLLMLRARKKRKRGDK